MTDLLATLWHARGLIAGVTLLMVVLGVLGTLFSAKYKSDGFLQFGGAIPQSREKGSQDKIKKKK